MCTANQNLGYTIYMLNSNSACVSGQRKYSGEGQKGSHNRKSGPFTCQSKRERSTVISAEPPSGPWTATAALTQVGILQSQEAEGALFFKGRERYRRKEKKNPQRLEKGDNKILKKRQLFSRKALHSASGSPACHFYVG